MASDVFKGQKITCSFPFITHPMALWSSLYSWTIPALSCLCVFKLCYSLSQKFSSSHICLSIHFSRLRSHAAYFLKSSLVMRSRRDDSLFHTFKILDLSLTNNTIVLLTCHLCLCFIYKDYKLLDAKDFCPSLLYSF